MGVFDFIKKKKQDDFSSLDFGSSSKSIEDPMQQAFNPGIDAEKNQNSGLNLPSYENEHQFDPFGNPRARTEVNSSYEQALQRNSSIITSTGDISKDIQIVLAKLDAIKAELNNINHRLEMLELRNQQQNPYQQQRNYWQ